MNSVVKPFFNNHPNLRLVVVERLRSMKKGGKGRVGRKFSKTLSSWNYRELINYIENLCEVNRINFRSVNPYKISQ